MSISFKGLCEKSCVYCREDDDGHTICIISFYVDDILMAGNSLAFVQRIKNQIKDNYYIKDLVIDSYILGCEVKKYVHIRNSSLTQY